MHAWSSSLETTSDPSRTPSHLKRRYQLIIQTSFGLRGRDKSTSKD